MNKLSLTLLICMFSISSAFAQFYNHLHTYDSTYDKAPNILLRSDNTLFVSGHCNDGSTDSPIDAMWMNISEDGSTILSKHHIQRDDIAFWNDYSGSVKPLPNGGIIMPYTLSVPYFTMNGRTFWWAGLILLNAQFDTTFIKTYTDTSQFAEAVYDCGVLQDGSFLLAGWQISSHLSVPDTSKGMLMRVSPSGTLLWKQTYLEQTGLYSYLQSVQPLDGDRSLIGGVSADSIHYGTNLLYYRERPWFLVINNSDGSMVKDSIYTSGFSSGSMIFKDVNGGYYNTGHKDSLVNSNTNDYASFPSYIAKLDTNFNISWITSFPYSYQPYSKHIRRPRQLSNGDYLVCGSAGTMQDPLRGLGWAARVNSSGAILWSNYYQDDIWTGYFHDFVERPDGSIILCGEARKDSIIYYRQSDVWLVGIDSNGNILSENTFVQNKAAKAISIDIYPNPNKGDFFLQTAEDGVAELYDMSGRLLERYDIKQGRSDIQVSKGTVTGNYLLQFTGAESGLMAGRRLVIE